MPEVVELSIPARSAYVGVLRLAIGALARKAQLDEERVDDLRIAVSEACTNALLARGEETSEPPLLVRWSEQAGSIVIEVTDPSARTAPARLPDDSSGLPARDALSMALLGSLVDRIEFTDATSSAGSVTRLIVDYAEVPGPV